MTIMVKVLKCAALTMAAVPLAAAADPLCIPAGDTVAWLDKNETAGGHTVACHVGKTEANLFERIKGGVAPGKTCQGADEASTFPEKKRAADLVAGAVNDNVKAVKTWLALPAAPAPAPLVLTARSKDGSNVGFVMKAAAKKGKSSCSKIGGYDCNDAKRFTVVLRRVPAPDAAGNVCIVRTAYPTS